ncbi:MAG: zinc-ribbon domain-containing protein [Deltaproteobacteria bacterium]|nr:zinc-ribbon domain-containing protein [Deltaproteobacteria bacterium]
MNIVCPACRKSFNIPEERLPKGETVLFPCPACKGTIGVDLRSRPGTEPPLPSQKAAKGEAGADIRAALEAEGLPSGEELKKKILRTVKDLPPMPQTTFKAHELVKDPNTNFEDLARVLETDQAIATRVLRMANSPYYGMSGTVSSLKHASAVLGVKTLEELIVMAGSSKTLSNRMEGYGLEPGDLWQHSLGVAFGSKIIATRKNPSIANDAFSAGLIHDVGKLVLDPYVLERKQAFLTFLSGGTETFLNAERHVLGFDHGEIAYELCTTWHVPHTLATAIRYHHDPSASDGNQLTCIVHIADVIAMMSGMGTGIDGMQYHMDEAVASKLRIEPDELSTIMLEMVEAVQTISSDMLRT